MPQGCFIAPSVSKLERRYRIVILHVMNRATFIEKLTEVQQIVGQLLRLLQASEHDKLLLTSTKLESITGSSASDLTRETRQSSASLSQAAKSRRAWDSTATSARGSICCGFTREARAGPGHF